ncbi:hypothetical protein RFI_19994 [Reticulomyxa filosa]|uniref:Uncharacterized protein n=1 Tax=Reticulomyxa filosa TaxID=46433 RepID=X6MUJ0_RETFI|nr:hypothetical protein RFI_19994 [Reticulomyxa filosa]|eukprot:ETO17331.1 hypothetical protein RFI_19994 [Reticulomyxa filosa]
MWLTLSCLFHYFCEESEHWTHDLSDTLVYTLIELIRCDEWTVEKLYQSINDGSFENPNEAETVAESPNKSESTDNQASLSRKTLSRRNRSQAQTQSPHQQQKKNNNTDHSTQSKSNSLIHDMVHFIVGNKDKRNNLECIVPWPIDPGFETQVTPSWIASSALSLLLQRIDDMVWHETEKTTNELDKNLQLIVCYLNDWLVLLRITLQLEILCSKGYVCFFILGNGKHEQRAENTQENKSSESEQKNQEKKKKKKRRK